MASRLAGHPTPYKRVRHPAAQLPASDPTRRRLTLAPCLQLPCPRAIDRDRTFTGKCAAPPGGTSPGRQPGELARGTMDERERAPKGRHLGVANMSLYSQIINRNDPAR